MPGMRVTYLTSFIVAATRKIGEYNYLGGTSEYGGLGIDVVAARCGRHKLQKLFGRLMTELTAVLPCPGELCEFAWGDHVTTLPPLCIR